MMFGQGQGNALLTLITRTPSFTHLVCHINQLPGHRLQQFRKESIIITFSHLKAKVAKFELVVTRVSVNHGSSFEQIIMGFNPRCCIPCFVEIGPLVPGKKILKDVYHI